MESIATMLASLRKTLRSGAAPGADAAFERGCDLADGKKEIFLPWKGFNGSSSRFFPPPKEAEVLASLHHPNWAACRPAARKLHARNCQQVYGVDLEWPVDFVLFWAPENNGKVQGGTATAVHLARHTNIPAFNLCDEATRESWAGLESLYRHRKRRFWTALFPLARWGEEVMRLDTALMQEVASRCNGQNNHAASSLLAGYMTAVREFNKGDDEFLAVAQEAERQLRVFLAKLRETGG